MIKLICPQCAKPVPVADDFTGAEVTCPSCQKVFPAPARYTPAVLSDPPPTPQAPPALPTPAPEPPAVPAKPSVPAKPPEPTYGLEPAPERPAPPAAPAGFVPPAQPPAPPVPAATTAPPPIPSAPVAAPEVPGGYTKSCGITISPKVVAWLPAILLTITFFCTFFPWVGAYVGGYSAHSQSAWRAMFGSPGTNPVLSQYMPGDGAWQKNVPSDAGLMVPFVLCLVLALLFAWAERGLGTLDPRRIPPLAKFWPWRRTVIAVAGGLAFLFVSIQSLSGFGLERAIHKSVREDPEIVKEREAATGSPSKLAAVQSREDARVAAFNLERTWWLDLAIGCNLVAVLAVLMSIQFERRGNKPPPRIVLHY